MAGLVYILCSITSGCCAVLLFREYRRRSSRLLFWSSLSFAGWTLNHALVFADLIVWPTHDLSLVRTAAALVAVSFMLYGLIWDAA